MIKKNKRKDDPNSGYYALPGGKLEANEKGLKHPEGRLESATRETKAETGIKLINPVLRGVILFDNKDRIFTNWEKKEDYLVYLCSATKYSGKLKESDEGIPLWVPEKDIPSLPKNSGDNLMYKWFMDEKFKKGMNLFGIIKHNVTKMDKENSWVNWF